MQEPVALLGTTHPTHDPIYATGELGLTKEGTVYLKALNADHFQLIEAEVTPFEFWKSSLRMA